MEERGGVLYVKNVEPPPLAVAPVRAVSLEEPSVAGPLAVYYLTGAHNWKR
jgi:hypothetical protein